MKKICQIIVASPYFEYFIIALILFNAVLMGLETNDSFYNHYQRWFIISNQIILGVFIFEVIIKNIAVAPRFGQYFYNGWNLFDFTIVVLSLIPFSAQYAMIARLFRLLRVLRLISVLPQLRLIVTTLLRSIPSMGHVMILLAILFYMYGIVGYHLFHEQLPEQWGSLPRTLLTLFTIATLEGWADYLKDSMQVTPWAWVYYISFIVIATFVIINLFIAIVLDNMETAKRETIQQSQDNSNTVLEEIEQLENQLQSLKKLLIKQ
ncbi:MAG: ion transporter [Thiotrichaceae bacterium]